MTGEWIGQMENEQITLLLCAIFICFMCNWRKEHFCTEGHSESQTSR